MKNLDDRVAAMEKTFDKEITDLKRDVRELIDLANRGRGAFWAAMTISGMIGALVGWALHYFSRELR